uniref:Capsid n=1 Tax=Avastrovirus 2 TaxID=1239438 RepID=K7SWB8_9VIRU|nr:capsid [Avastrovirus 2]
MAGGAAAPSGAKPKQQQPKKAKPKQKQKTRAKVTKPVKQEVKKLDRQVKALKKKTDGPKVNDVMKTTVTIGTLSGQTGAGLNRQLRVPFNPLLMKSSEGLSSTPLSIRASCYELWKLLHVELVATPLSGYSNVVGSVGFMALTLNGLEANVDSIDSIKARRHVQMALGRPAKMRLTSRELAGPREGWWLVDTSQSPADSYGPAIDLLLAYKTENLLNTTTAGQTATFTGTLWQIEVRVVYAFSTYNPKPGLQNLVAQTLSTGKQVTVTTSLEDGSIIMTTTDQQLLALLTPRAEGDHKKGKSQTVWAIAGAAVDAAASVLGPWGWLLKGGFWLVRKIFGGSALRNAAAQYQIYPSIEAAMSDQPIYGEPGQSDTVNLPIVHISEVMNPNPESNQLSGPSVRSTPLPTQTLLPLPQLELPSPLPANYVFSGGNYTPIRDWTGSTLYLTGVPFYAKKTGDSQLFGVNNNNMTRVNCTTLEVYDFTDTGVFFSAGSNLSQGVIHTGKTMLQALSSGYTQPWLYASAGNTEWALPTWAGYPTPGEGDLFLQMQNTTDTDTHTTAVYVYFLVAYRSQQKLIAFWNNGTGEQTPPKSLMCLYNVDAGRSPVLPLQFRILRPLPEGQAFHQEPSHSDDDDDISLADSCFVDEAGGVDPLTLELERQQLLQRLRDLDLQRFHTG